MPRQRVARFPLSTTDQLAVEANIAFCLMEVGRVEESVARMQSNFTATQRECGSEDELTLIAATSLSAALVDAQDYAGCTQFIQENSVLDTAGRVLGPENIATIYLRRNQARALYQPSEAPLGDVRRAVEILEDVSAISNRVLGPDHPGTQKIQKHLDAAREKLTHAE